MVLRTVTEAQDMASLIDVTEAQLFYNDRLPIIQPDQWLRLDPGQDIETVHMLVISAWERIEARIPNRFAPRDFTVIIRTDEDDELVYLPLTPVTVATAELFDPDTGTYTAQSVPKAGPEPGSVYLSDCGIWRLSGMSGPAVAVDAPRSVHHAVLRLVAYAFENRGDVGHDFDMEGAFIGSGAADLIRAYVRV